MEKKVEGIILNSIDYKENHKILYLLTKEGHKSLLVYNAKKIKKGLLNETQNLTYLKTTCTDQTLPKVTSIEVVDYYNEIKGDLKKMSVSSYVLEVLYRFIHPDINPGLLFEYIKAFFTKLKDKDDVKTLLLQFRIKMLYFLGFEPNFKTCIHCGSNKNLVGLSIYYGAMECVVHASKNNIGNTATNIIRLLYLDKSLEINISDDEAYSYISKLIDEYYENHFKDEIKAKKMLQQLNCY